MAFAAPMAGWLIAVEDVPDPVFSEHMLGDGIAIDPTDGRLCAPCPATVVMIAPSLHSVTLRTDVGAEILIHVGIETVGLQGRGFEAHVADGDLVQTGDLLLSFDLDRVGLEAKSLVSPVIVTSEGFMLGVGNTNRLVEAGETIGTLSGAAVQAEAKADGETRTLQATVGFAHGLHARPAGRIADCAKGFASHVAILAGERHAKATSPTAMMALDLKRGDAVTLSARGKDSEAALRSIAGLMEKGDADESAAKLPQAGPVALADNEIAGICALPGSAFGTAVRWVRPESNASGASQGADVERAALQAAKADARARLEALADEASGPAAEIARAHVALLEDDELNATAEAAIRGGASAASAWQDATRQASDALSAADSPRMRERVADLADLAWQVLRSLQGDAGTAAALPDRTILIADELLPSELMTLPRDRITGIAIAGGGPTSHVAIIAASFGIPTLVAMGPALARVADGAEVLLDASAGKLVVDPSDKQKAAAGSVAAPATGVARTRDGERFTLLANLGGLDDVGPALEHGAEGCGLLRTEFLFLGRAEPPGEEEQASGYQAIIDALDGRPLTIRTLDIGGDKPVPFISFPDEENPALGMRGIRTRLIDPQLADTQLRAIARLKGEAVKVMVPMVASIDEVRFVRERLGELGAPDGMCVGAMVETPAAALIAGRLANACDFLSVGSNDLAQYALAMDRTNPLLAASIDALHPAVLKLIAMTASAAGEAATPVSLCGGLASEPLAAPILIGLGIRELSVVPAAIPAVREAIAKVTLADCRAAAKAALDLDSAAQVRALAAGLLGEAR